jgi:hypothetical protein
MLACLLIPAESSCLRPRSCQQLLLPELSQHLLLPLGLLHLCALRPLLLLMLACLALP